MAVPVTITDLTTTVASNSPQGSDAIGTNADDYIRALSAILKESGATLYTATGTDTITFSTTPTFSAYASGQRFFVKAAAANTGAVTVNINTLGAKNVLKSGATALSAGDIPAANAHFLIEYDGTQFQLLNPVYGLFGAGTVSLPAITLNGDTDSGLYQIGANNLGVAVSGAKVLDIASTGLGVTGEVKTTGNLGIGAAPGATAGRSLDIEGLTLTPFVVLRQTGTTANTTTYKQDNANSRVELSSDTFPIHLRIGGTSIGVVSSTGLEVTGALSSNWIFSLTGGSVNPIVVSGATTGESYGKFTNTSGQTVFGVNNSVAGTLYSGGTAYASFFGSNVAKNVDLIVNGATVASLSSTGLAVTGTVNATTTIKTGGYTVATLPAGTVGMRAYVTDATAPTYNGALTGGGAVTVPVFYNGTAWVSA